MSRGTEADTAVTPWHLWLVGIVALLWSGMGALDYVMTQTRNEAYMGAFSQEQLDFFYGIPAWAIATWAIAVWGGVLGAILLLFRSRHAVGVFLASLIAMVMTAFQNYVLSDGMAVMGDAFSLAFTGAIFVVSLALFMYARNLYRRHVLT